MRRSQRRRVRTRKLRPRADRLEKTPFRGVDNTRDLDDILEHNKIFQELLGFSEETIPSLYEQAVILLQNHRIEEAIASFVLLTKLNPYVADFWIGLGLSHMAQEEYSAAFDAFLMALTMEPLRIDTYNFMIDCCLDMENYRQADALLQQAIAYAKRYHVSEMHQAIKKLEEKIALKRPH